MSKYVREKRHNKQHDARAASFKRIAKELRGVGRKSYQPNLFTAMARVFDDEAKLIRSMR